MQQTATLNNETNTRFAHDVLKGLSAYPKYLDSKYFYDAIGDQLFQQLMGCEAYYPTRCETEIFAVQTDDICNQFTNGGLVFDLVELGAGDATKSAFLLQGLLEQGANFCYQPIDISKNIIDYLELALPVSLPGLKIQGFCGEYFDMLEQATLVSANRKIVLLLGGNLGNMPVSEAQQFCRELRGYLSPGDLVLIGFDLKKNPAQILAAYNDPEGITRQFNLNLLQRINRELNADFDASRFEHYPTYDPSTGACKSFLVSLADQTITINGQPVIFANNEYIYTEISQKYTISETDDMALTSGFRPVRHFLDGSRWFMDTIWCAE